MDALTVGSECDYYITIHLDVDYMRGYRDFTWDPDRFPAPPALLHELRAHDVRVVTIIDAGVKEDLGAGYDVADDGIARAMFIRTAGRVPDRWSARG